MSTSICDFCSEPHVAWRYPAHSFVAYAVAGVVGQSVGDWAACAVGHMLIEAGDRSALVERSLNRLLERHPDMRADEAELRLVMVIPYDRVYDCRTVLTPQFKDKAIYRLTEREAVTYKQVVVFGIRRTRQERDRMSDHAVSQANEKLNDLTWWYDEIPPLPNVPDRYYAIPPSPECRSFQREFFAFCEEEF